MDTPDMSTELVGDVSRIVGLLAEYLLASPRLLYPGVDGACVADVVWAEYPAASEAGWVPRPAELTRRHQDLALALASFFHGCWRSTVLAS